MKVNREKIQILMAKQGLTQKELSEKCGMPRQNISSVLSRGSALPKTVGKVAMGLGVQVEELLELSK